MLKITPQQLLNSSGAILSAYVSGLKDGTVRLSHVKMTAPLTVKLNTFIAEQKLDNKGERLFAEKSERSSASPEIAKELGASEVWAKLEKLADEYLVIAKKHPKYSASGKGGLVLYLRGK